MTHDTLPRMQNLVARHVCDGLPTAEIAQRLSISPFTVMNHLKAVYLKLGVQSRAQLVRVLAGVDQIELRNLRQAVSAVANLPRKRGASVEARAYNAALEKAYGIFAARGLL